MEPSKSPFHLRDFEPDDEPILRSLILAGLGQRFGTIDETLNPDLHHLYAHYSDSTHGVRFLVAENENGEIIGCGALIREHGSSEIARIVRVSVLQQDQGKGIGRIISQALIDTARERGFKRLVVETNDDWESALRLYQSLGFQEEQRLISEEFGFVEVHMGMALIHEDD